ncbi:MAG: SDR family oxidoreductase [Acidobacteriia bacterium]|nr:SDR family oxidoreductase [Terriglobia bacterium]
MRLESKVAIITGAASGIGRATAELFAKEGARVVVADIDSAGGEQTVSNIRAKGGEARFVRADISKDEDAKRISEEAARAYGRIDILVNNAAAFVFKRLEEATVEDWQRALHVNVMGTALCTKYAVEHMKKTGGGAVVNISSVHGFVGQQGYLPYAATKAALVQMSRNMASELGSYNIRVNTVCPGAVLTDHTLHRLKELGMTEEDLGAQHLLKRGSQPCESAAAILFMASEESSFVTGAFLMVDGGYTAQ